MRRSTTVDQLGPERLGSALRKMAEDLVAERRHVVLLKRENRELRMQLEEERQSSADGADNPPGVES